MKPSGELSLEHRLVLLDLAWDSIARGFGLAEAPAPGEPASGPLRERRATFVTLERAGELRGCIGSLTASVPLAEDVVRNARLAAFEDPRFAPLECHELPHLDLHISVLSGLEPLRFGSEADLLAQLRPRVDGLLLEGGRHRGTFLPSVWEACADPSDFLCQLKRKAGLPPDYWSQDLRLSRYTVQYFGEAWTDRH